MENEQNLMAEGKRRGPGLELRGICMGTADVIPGVSGGTVALIMGIYDELVGTIASIDQRVVGALVRGRWTTQGSLLGASNTAMAGGGTVRCQNV